MHTLGVGVLLCRKGYKLRPMIDGFGVTRYHPSMGSIMQDDRDNSAPHRTLQIGTLLGAFSYSFRVHYIRFLVESFH